jgi:hypothetical protein
MTAPTPFRTGDVVAHRDDPSATGTVTDVQPIQHPGGNVMVTVPVWSDGMDGAAYPARDLVHANV